MKSKDRDKDVTLINGQIARVTPMMTFGASDDVQNTWHLIKVSGANNDSAVALAIQEYMELIYNIINPRIATAITYDAIDIFFISGSQALGQFPWLTLVNGLDAAETVAPGVCMLSLARTGISKRIGKKFFGVSTEAQMFGGSWAAAIVLDILAATLAGYTNFTASNGVTLRGIVYDRLTTIARDGIAFLAEPNPAYQRRRKVGSGS